MQTLGGGAFTADIDSTPLTNNGPFTFYVRARDAAGTASVMPRTLTVANPTAPQTPVTIAPPADPAPVDETPVVEAPVVTAPPAETPVAARPVVNTVVDRRGSSDRTVVTGAGDDRVTTGSGDDVIRTGAGNDVIRPGRGRDTVYAGAGNDIVHAQHGRSVIECGLGRDVVYANRYTVTRGCETVLVASNNRFVKVKVGANGRPVMPRKR